MTASAIPQSICLVAGYDFGDTAELALDRAMRMSTQFALSSLHVITAVPDWRSRLSSDVPETESRETAADELRAKLRAVVVDKLGQLCEDLDRAYRHNVHVHTRLGNPADEILGLAEEVRADMILVGTHGRTGASRLMLGSVSEEVVRNASCPVLVLRDARYPIGPARLPEPPCPDCVAVRRVGDAWYCELHAELEDRHVGSSPLRVTFQRDMEKARREAWVVN